MRFVSVMEITKLDSGRVILLTDGGAGIGHDPAMLTEGWVGFLDGPLGLCLQECFRSARTVRNA